MINRPDFAECRNCHCLAARREARRLIRVYDERLRPFGLTANQFSMLTTLILAGEIAVTALADRLGIERTTMTRNLALGQLSGLVTVTPGKDRRTRLVNITNKGRALAEAALPAWREVQAQFQRN